jgi:hypothetical protein
MRSPALFADDAVRGAGGRLARHAPFAAAAEQSRIHQRLVANSPSLHVWTDSADRAPSVGAVHVRQDGPRPNPGACEVGDGEQVFPVDGCTFAPQQDLPWPGHWSRDLPKRHALPEVPVPGLQGRAHGQSSTSDAAWIFNSRRAALSRARTLLRSRIRPTLMNGFISSGADASVAAASSLGTAPNFIAGS